MRIGYGTPWQIPGRRRDETADAHDGMVRREIRVMKTVTLDAIHLASALAVRSMIAGLA